jgi:hypothetical protein
MTISCEANARISRRGWPRRVISSRTRSAPKLDQEVIYDEQERNE